MKLLFPKPRIVISGCLEFDTCRFNDNYIMNKSCFKSFPIELIENQDNKWNL